MMNCYFTTAHHHYIASRSETRHRGSIYRGIPISYDYIQKKPILIFFLFHTALPIDLTWKNC
jgi:hypothetical protein